MSENDMLSKLDILEYFVYTLFLISPLIQANILIHPFVNIYYQYNVRDIQ